MWAELAQPWESELWGHTGVPRCPGPGVCPEAPGGPRPLGLVRTGLVVSSGANRTGGYSSTSWGLSNEAGDRSPGAAVRVACDPLTRAWGMGHGAGPTQGQTALRNKFIIPDHKVSPSQDDIRVAKPPRHQQDPAWCPAVPLLPTAPSCPLHSLLSQCGPLMGSSRALGTILSAATCPGQEVTTCLVLRARQGQPLALLAPAEGHTVTSVCPMSSGGSPAASGSAER